MGCLGLWSRRRRRDLALPVPECGHSPRRVASGPPHLYVAPAHPSSSLNTQQATAEGEQLSWRSEKRLLSQRLEGLQRAVARLGREKTELQQLNAELRRTLEQVKQAFTASAKPQGPREHNTFPRGALWSPLLVSFPLPFPPWAHTFVFSRSSGSPLPPQMHLPSGTTFLPHCSHTQTFDARVSGTVSSCSFSSIAYLECFLPAAFSAAISGP